MGSIELKNSCIFYYGNPAGYVEEDTAIVDFIFQNDEFEEWIKMRSLKPKWTEGVFERLSEGRDAFEYKETQISLKSCRIWQLKSDVDPKCKFIGYEELIEKFGQVDKDNYKIVYDGELETNNLEDIYIKFNQDYPYGFKGHSLSMSDVVELYDSEGSEFNYVDRFGFKEIDFEVEDQNQGMNMSI